MPPATSTLPGIPEYFRVYHRSRGCHFALGSVLPYAAHGRASVDQRQRSAPGGDVGGRACPLIVMKETLSTLSPRPQGHGGRAGSTTTPAMRRRTSMSSGVIVFLSGLCRLFCLGVLCLLLRHGQVDQQRDREGRTVRSPSGTRLSTLRGSDLHKRQTRGPRDQSRDAAEDAPTSRWSRNSFRSPRLDIDDSNQATADLHAREDLLLDHYSSRSPVSRAIRIPIEPSHGGDCQEAVCLSAAGGQSGDGQGREARRGLRKPACGGLR